MTYRTIGLVQFPRKSTLPLVSLMRLSSWHKAQGDRVVLHATPLDRPDVVYVSTLFTWQQAQVNAAVGMFQPSADVVVGGPGVLPIPTQLPAEVDVMPNDYSLYGIEFGIGYSSRGCPNKCGFCPVPKIEGRMREASAIADLLNPRSNRLLLLDNNFFASDWRPKLEEVRQRGLHVCWPQGLDIRLIDAEQALALADLHARRQLWNQRFTRRGGLHFAWDNRITDYTRAEVERGIQLLFNVGFSPNDLTFYVLIGYRSTVDDEVERITVLHEHGIQPKVMVYRDYGERDQRDPVRMDIQHWNDGHVWRAVPNFRDYRRSLAA